MVTTKGRLMAFSEKGILEEMKRGIGRNPEKTGNLVTKTK